MPGFVNIDSNPDTNPDLCVHVPPIPYGPEEVDGILASHVLEHMERSDGLAFLKDCKRVLAPDGILEVHVPDTRAVLRNYVRRTPALPVDIPETEGMDLTDLDIICHLWLYSTIQPSRHLWSYDEETLVRALAQSGFEWIRVDPGWSWWDLHVKAMKNPPTGAGFQRVKLRPPPATGSRPAADGEG